MDAILATRLEEWKRGIYNRGVEEGVEKRIEKCKEAQRLEIAKQMLAEGIDEALIARACGLTLEKVAALKRQ